MRNAEDYDNWFADRRILLTGGFGFLGKAIHRAAVDRGATVKVTDVAAHPASGEHLDVTSAESTVGAILEAEPDVIIHLAGVSHINEAQSGPFRAFDVNVLGTINVMRAAAKLKNKRLYPVHVVIASSNHVYGTHPMMSARPEESTLNQLDVYGASKHAADVVARSLGMASHIPTVALRHVNAYGPGGHPSHITTAACAAAIKGEPLTLRGDGTARKAYLDVTDVAAAYLALAKHACDLHVIGRAFNAAPAGTPPSVTEWVDTVNQVASDRGWPAKAPVVMAAGKGEQSGYYEHLDAAELRKWTGWWPRVSPEVGIGRLLDSLT
jgi:nucleoside-diphosphate-sugar epimerase